MKKRMITVLIFTGFMFTLVACGDEENNEGSTNIESATNGDSNSTSTVDLTAANWEFDQDTYTVTSGEITFNLSNEEGNHGINVDGTDVEIEGDGSFTSTLEPGEYLIRCSIPCGTGHADMVSTLIVE